MCIIQVNSSTIKCMYVCMPMRSHMEAMNGGKLQPLVTGEPVDSRERKKKRLQ